MKVDIERILFLRNELRSINKENLESIEFYKEGKKLEIDSKIIDDWQFTGLNNCDFIDDEGNVCIFHPYFVDEEK